MNPMAVGFLLGVIVTLLIVSDKFRKSLMGMLGGKGRGSGGDRQNSCQLCGGKGIQTLASGERIYCSGCKGTGVQSTAKQ
jgi:hypothetical protein